MQLLCLPETVSIRAQETLTSCVVAGGGAAASIRLEASLLALLATLLSHICSRCTTASRPINCRRIKTNGS